MDIRCLFVAHNFQRALLMTHICCISNLFIDAIMEFPELALCVKMKVREKMQVKSCKHEEEDGETHTTRARLVSF